MNKLKEFLLLPVQLLLGAVTVVGVIILWILPYALAIALGLAIYNWLS